MSASRDRDWVSWYLREVSPESEVWSHPADLIRERQLHNSRSLNDFYRVSRSLPLQLLRDETNQVTYLHSLRKELSLRVPTGETVGVVGPTGGAEIEAIHRCGARPVLIHDGKPAVWLDMVECRMLKSAIPYQDHTFAALRRRKTPIRYLVVTPWDLDIVRTFRDFHTLPGKFGFLLCPATSLMAVCAAQSSSMVRLDSARRDVAVYYRTDIGEFPTCSTLKSSPS